MKRNLLLLLVLLATAGMTLAQDVYTAGSYWNLETSKFEAAVYMNNELLYLSGLSGASSLSSTDVLVDESTGDVYWVRNSIASASPFHGDVMKNDNVYLNNLSGTGIEKIALGDDLYAAGYSQSSGVLTAKLWKNSNTDPYASWGDGTNNYHATDVFCVKGGPVYTCGYKNLSSGTTVAYVWKNNNPTPEFSVDNARFFDVVVYDGNVYTLGWEGIPGGTKTAKVWKNGEELYALDEGSSLLINNLIVFGGDVYCYSSSDSHAYVWKNGQILHDVFTEEENHYLRNDGLDVTTDGVYYLAADWNGENDSHVTTLYKDEEVVFETTTAIYDGGMDVAQEACGDVIYALPYSEGFETGETDWNCWTTIDMDNNNGILASYWDRAGSCEDITPVMPATGDHYARHTHNTMGTAAQEGWLVTPRLLSQLGRNVTLTFQSYTTFSYSDEYASVWVSTDEDPTDLDNYTQVWAIPANNYSWQEQSVDLSAYNGQLFYVAFKYEAQGGNNAPAWNIDDISITEDWTPCPPVATFPFEERFDTNPFGSNTCWYLLDADLNGALNCWQWDESNECAYHHFGPNNGISQEGWMITPAMNLESGMNYTLTFDTKYYYPSDLDESSVWIAIDKDGTPNPDDYTRLWSETAPTENWVTQTINLSEYAGHKVNIAFKYGGIYAHGWYVDNVVVNSALPKYNITVVANNVAYGNVFGGGEFEEGSTCTIGAGAYTGYEFKKWTKDGVDVTTNASYSFTVTENATYTAVFGEPSVTYYTITTNVNPAGAGTVTGGDTYPSGATAVLTAVANNGYEFTKWNDNNTDNPRIITVTGNATYTANFTQVNYTITVLANPAEGGTVDGGGTYPYGQFVSLTANPAAGYDFLAWNDGEIMPTRTVKVTGDATYVALFANASTTTYTITAVANDPSLGEVSGSGTYPEGTEVTLTATPFGINVFKKWSDGNTDNPRVVTVTGDATYTAQFEVPTVYTITVLSLNPEMGSVSGGGNFAAGSQVTIQANPFGGFYFDGWDDNNYDNPRTITVTGNKTYKAKFSASQSSTYTLTVTCNATQGFVEGSGNYPAGTTVTVKATPYDGYVFDHWNDGNKDNPRSVTVNDNLTLVAFFYGVGVDENDATSLSLYPNPAKESLRIEGIEANSEVVFYNSLGMMVKTINANADEDINVSDLASGLYLIRCGNHTLRFVKE